MYQEVTFFRARWVLTWMRVEDKRVPKAQLCVLGFQDPRLTTLPTGFDSAMTCE